MSEQTQAVEQKLQTIGEYSRQLVIHNGEGYKRANLYLLEIKIAQSQVDELFDPGIKKAHEAHQAALATKAKFSTPLKDAEKRIKTLMLDYNREQDRIADEERRRLQKEADEKARREREQHEKKQAQLKTESKRQEIQQRIEAIQPVIVSVIKDIPKVSGSTILVSWRSVVVDKSQIPMMFLIVDEAGLRRLGRKKDKPEDIPGIKWEQEQTMRAG